jgi:signal transduction histidine kinase/ligand-binding sensor domain-containing protein
MWFGTLEGVSHYDGLKWTTYSAKDAVGGGVDTLCGGADGNIYAGGSWGVSRFEKGRWTRVFPSAGQAFGAVKRIAMGQDGTLWAATAWGALRCGGGQFVLYTGPEGAALVKTNHADPLVRVELLPDAILSRTRGNAYPTNRSDFFEVYEDHQGRIWLGTEGGEVLCFKPTGPVTASSEATPAAADGEWTLYNESDGLVLNRRPRILQLDNGVVWVVNYGSLGQANQFDGRVWKSTRLAEFGASDDCSCLLQTKDGGLWIGCNGSVCANRNGHWQVYQPPKVPVPTVRTLLLQAADGALWIAGQDAEILRLDYQTPSWLTYEDLSFQWESPDGAQWFLHRDGRVVVHKRDQWTSYSAEDGLIDAPTALLGARSGEVWVAGSHQHTAATARFDGEKWTRFIHDDLSWGVDWRAVFESSDGSLWFGAAADSSKLGKTYLDGVMQYRQGQWIHHDVSSHLYDTGQSNAVIFSNSSRDPIGKFYGLGESRDGRIWGGQFVLTYLDGQKWQIFPQTQDFQIGTIEAILTTRERDLWIGSRSHGVFRYDGQHWQRYHVKNGLVANNIRSLAQSSDGAIWVATDRGVSRFDGSAWTADVLPAALNMSREGGSLKAAPSGAIWINHFTRAWTRRAWPKSPPLDTASGEFWTVCHVMEHAAPKTLITLGQEKVSQPGNLTVSWKGIDPWQSTKDSDIQYSFRLDAGPWSAYTHEQAHSLLALPSGHHRFQVRARDQAFNVDPNPATLEFVVVPPVWLQGWFIGLMVLLTGAILTQTVRVARNGHRLRQSNQALAAEVEERKRIEMEMEETHKQLLCASHQAGMAEVATNVLHNVGNVLNSVNVSTDVVIDKVRKFRVGDLPKVADLLSAHAPEPNFLAADPKGKMIPAYLKELSGHLAREQEATLTELGSLQQNINHIKDIVTMQQQYSRLAGFTESVKLTELVQDALRLNEGALSRHKIHLACDFQEQGMVVVEKHRVLQILVNLIRNAKYACEDSGREDRKLTIRTLRSAADRVQIQVSDNGVGIPSENLTKIFGQGFTTRKEGHGFGLHSAANAAAELGGSLTVQSDGPGKGAHFTLEFPINKSRAAKA